MTSPSNLTPAQLAEEEAIEAMYLEPWQRGFVPVDHDRCPECGKHGGCDCMAELEWER